MSRVPGSERKAPPPIRRVVFAEDAVGRFGGVETLLRVLAPRLRESGLRVEYLSHEPPSGPAPTPGPVRCFAVPGSASRWAAGGRTAPAGLLASLGPRMRW
ncbi:Uncharacterised protein [Rothia kristinae]|nr:Uncharacterised protein [Rothia kristinae]